MEYPLKREMLAPGLHFSVLQDKKFKHNRIAIHLAVKLDAETASAEACRMEHCLSEDSFRKLSERLGNGR